MREEGKQVYIVIDCFDIVLRYIQADTYDEAIEVLRDEAPELEDEVMIFKAEQVKRGWNSDVLSEAEQEQ